MPVAFRYLSDLATYRHLCWNLVASDLRSRFRRSYIGILWALIQPLGFSLIIAGVWGGVFKVDDYWAFGIYVMSGMVLWEYFNNIVVISQDSLINAEGYLKQSRVPFFIFQVRTPLSGFVTMLLGFVGLLLMMAVFQRFPPLGLHYLYVPAFFLVFLAFAIPVATIMSIVGTHFRDAKHISGLVMQALFFLSPVMLSRDVLNQPELQFMQYANPMVPLYDLFRAPLLYGEHWHMQSLAVIGIWIAAAWAVSFFVQARAGRKLIYAI